MAEPRLVPSADGATRLTTQVIESESDFLALREEWDELLAHCPGRHFFHCHAWKWLSWDCVARAQGRSLLVITVRDGPQLVAAFPLTIISGVAQFLHSDTWEYRDVLLRPDAPRDQALRLMWGILKQHPDIDLLQLQNIRLPSCVDQLLHMAPGALQRREAHSPVIRLNQFTSWEHYAATLSKKLVADQRRQWRRIRERFPQLAGRVIDNPADAGVALEWMIEHKAKWVEVKGLPASPWTGERKRLLREGVRMTLERGQLLFMEIHDGQDRVSAGFGFLQENEFTFEMFAYSLAHENFSPSRLLQELLIRECMARGVQTFDFLPGGGGEYKHTWATDYVDSASYTAAVSRRGARRMWRENYLRIPVIRPRGLHHHLPVPLLDLLRKGLGRA